MTNAPDSRAAAAAKLLVTLAALVAPPVALVAAAGWPLPRGPVDLARVLDQVVAGLIPTAVWINVLAVVAWVAWIVVVVMVAAEMAAIVRDRPSARWTPMFARRIAQVLVTSAVLLANPATTATALAVPDQPASSIAVDQLPEPADAPTGSTQVLEVREQTSWSGLADLELGDPTLGAALREANVGRQMDDGTVISIDTLFVEDGWQLVIPSDAATARSADTDVPVSASTVSGGPTTAVGTDAGLPPIETDSAPVDVDEGGVVWEVRDGDSLWTIAEDTLTEAGGGPVTEAEVADYWLDVVDVVEPDLRPPGDPDLIYPGQSFTLPAPPVSSAGSDDVDAPAAADPDTSAATTNGSEGRSSPLDPATSVPDGRTTDDADASATASESGPVASGSDVADGATANGPSDLTPSTADSDDSAVAAAARSSAADRDGRTGAPLEPPPTDTQTTPASRESAAPWVLATGGLGIVAAGVVGVLRRMRRQRLRQRRERGTTPPAPPVTGTEQQLRAAQDPDTVWLIDRVLRDLAGRLDPEDPPPVSALVLTDDRTLTVLLSAPHPAPTGWTAPTQLEWSRDLDDVDHAQLQGADHFPGPLPTMVTLGTKPSRQDGNRPPAVICLDLEHAGVTQVDGDLDDVTATMATMAVELATSPLADDVQIACVGMEGLPSLDRLHQVTADQAIVMVDQHTERVGELVDDPTVGSPALAGRLAGVAASWTPTVVFDPTGAVAERTAAAVADAPRCGMALVAGPAVPVAASWRLRVDEDGIAITTSPRGSGTTQLVRHRANLTDEQLRDITVLVDHELHSPDVPTEVIDIADDVRSGMATQLLGPSEGPTVRLLGPVDIIDTPGRCRRSQSTELIAYLALHPAGTTGDTLMERLWPNGRPDTNRLNRVVSDARGALGSTDDGQLRLPHVKGHTTPLYRLAPSTVACDLVDLEHLVAAAATTDDPDEHRQLLRRALEPVTGEPFTGKATDWGWAHAEGLTTRAIVAIDQAATDLTRVALTAGDVDLARWATCRGLTGNPGAIGLLELRLDVAAAAGSIAEADAVMDEARAVLTDDDGPEYDDTLLDDLAATYDRVRQDLAAA